MYQIDSKYNEIREQLLQLSAQTNSFISVEQDFWESVSKRRSQSTMKSMQSSLQAALSYFSQIEQSVVISKSGLQRLDLLQLENVLREIDQLQKSHKLDEAASNEIKQRFEQLLAALRK